MSAPRKKAPFQTEVAIAILALVLVMVIMNFAANRTLSRVTLDLREAHRENLTIAALRISAVLERDSSELGLATSLSDVVSREDIDYAFILDAGMKEIARAPEKISGDARRRIRTILLSNGESGPFLQNKYQFTYHRESESEWEVFHCPLSGGAQWRILALARRTPTLAAVERDARYLLISGIVIVTLLSLGVFAFFRGVTLPFKRISASVAEVGAGAEDAESAVDELVNKYKQTIEQLRSKEKSLLQLNERLEGRLGDIERFNSSLLGAIKTGVVVIDGSGRLIGINEMARTYLGTIELSADTQDSCEDYVGLFAEYPEIKSRVDGVLLDSGCDVSDFEYERTGVDGSANSFRVSLMPLIEGDGALRELMLLISDQTEVVRAQKRLEDSRQLATLGEMSAGLAHQLRNSISAAMGFSALARRKTENADLPGAVKPLESLVKELQDEAALVDRFLSFARPLSLAADSTLVSGFLADSLAAYHANPQTDCRVQLKVQSDGEAQLDTLLLKQVIGNLVDNALRASDENNSPVDITADVSATEVVIIVSDYGCGISAEEQEKIFTPFYSSSPSGAGLGLPLARKIVELHGGMLELVSRPDCGSTFTVQLPRYQSGTVQTDKKCEESSQTT